MSDSTIPEFMRDLNVDAVAWTQARDGDYLLLLDPASRANYDVFVIEGVPTHVDATMHAYTKRVQGHEEFPSSYRKAANRVFNQAAWQVWRDFTERPINDALTAIAVNCDDAFSLLSTMPDNNDRECLTAMISAIKDRQVELCKLVLP